MSDLPDGTDPSSRDWGILATGFLVTMVAIVFARLAFGLLVPGMRGSLGLSYSAAANLASASSLGYLGLVLVAGRLAARRGARTSVLLGTCLIALGFGGMALASHYAALLAFMLLLGIGTSFSYTPVVSLVAARFARRRGLAIGLMSSGVGLGFLLVGVLAPYFQLHYGAEGWRGVWAVFLAVALLCLGAVIGVLPKGGATGASPADTGARPAVHRQPRVLAVAMLYAITGLIYITQATFMYSYALECGLSPRLAGGLASSMGVLSIFGAPAWGMVSDRIGRGRGLLIALGAVVVAMLAPVLWPAAGGFALHYVLLGLTISGLFTNILAAASEAVAPAQAPVAVSFVTFFYACGQLVGPFASGLVIDHGGGFGVAFGACALLAAAGIGVVLRMRTLPRVAEPR